MSKINDLIKKLCPNGMDFKSIDSVADLYYGKGNNIPKDGGDYPVYGCYGIVSSTSTFNNEDTPIVGHIGSAGKVSWGAGKHYVTYNGTICKPKNKNELNSRYLYHVLLNLHLENNVKGSQPFLSSSDFGPIKIAIPPLEIQEEIVKILDKFVELEAELEEELEERKSQYEFWRGKLLNKKNNNYKKYNITEICKSISAGGDVPEDTIKGISKPQDDYKYPVISNGVGENAIYGYSKNYRVDVQSCVTIAARGTIGYHEVRYGKFTPIIRLITLIPDEKLISAKYLHYALYGHEFKPSGGSIPQLTTPTVKQLDLIIPPVEEQNRIVGILDKFDKLVNDITDGLPAEIELRRKQYEYYRNKLLNFEDIQYE